MTQSDRMEIAIKAIATYGQAEVARRIGRSPALVNRLKKGTLDNPNPVLELIEAEFGASTVDCPVLGHETPLAECVDARARLDRPPLASSSQSAKLYRACQNCAHKGGAK